MSPLELQDLRRVVAAVARLRGQEVREVTVRSDLRHMTVELQVGFELLGVKAVRAFDATVVIVSLSVRTEGKAARMVGSYLTEGDATRGAALAVLNATNRVLGNYFATR